MRRSATAIIVDKDNQVLLMLRDDKPTIPYPNMWDLFGGRAEDGETMEACLFRELKEELNLAPRNVKPFRVYTYDDARGQGEIEDHVFVVGIEGDEKLDLHEGQKMQFFSPKEVSAMSIAFQGDAILRDYYGA